MSTTGDEPKISQSEGGGGGGPPAHDGTSFTEKLSDALPVDAITLFFSRPADFIVGSLVMVFLVWWENATKLVIEFVLLVFGGAEPFASPPGENPIGLADLPVLAMRLFLSPFGGVGQQLRAAVAVLGSEITNVASAAGPFGPAVAYVLWAIIFFAVLWAGETVVRVGLEIVPGGSAVLALAKQVWSLPKRLLPRFGGDS